jgi:hypothetical protein
MSAQTQLEFAPYVGLYRPTRILASESDSVKQLKSTALGLRVTKWGPGRLGLEVSVGYAPSALWTSSNYSGTPVYPAHVLTVSAKALVRMPLPGLRGGLHVGTGLGAVGHGGWIAYPGWYSGPRTFLGVIANLGGVIKLAAPVGVRFDVEDFMYSARLGPCTRTGPGYGSVCDVYQNRAGISGGSRFQNDLVLSLGVAFALNRTAQPRAL